MNKFVQMKTGAGGGNAPYKTGRVTSYCTMKIFGSKSGHLLNNSKKRNTPGKYKLFRKNEFRTLMDASMKIGA